MLQTDMSLERTFILENTFMSFIISVLKRFLTFLDENHTLLSFYSFALSHFALWYMALFQLS